ncbi:hypothetical protein KR222_003225 [Zaprionus bogoriensis]|nr:hypothetical protein KR222_003225 [Zaprionus bogoriensis]
MLKLWLYSALLVCVYTYNHGQDLIDFQEYMVGRYLSIFADTVINTRNIQIFQKEFNKSYTTVEENNANYYFIYHRNLVNQQNRLADRNASSYRVKVNQFSDIRLITFAARLPQAVYPTTSHNSTPISTEDTVADEINLLEEYGINVTAQDQGTVCSGSWAYAAAKSIQIFSAIPNEKLPLNYSAQNLIDCVGMSSACTTQVPQMAFDYLTQVNDALLLSEVDYPRHDNGLQGMCIPTMAATGVKVETYSTIADGDDASVKRFVSSGIPVIVEYNPATFGFMHYASGVYMPPVRARTNSSQFLVVVGYGHDADSGLDYWLCLNSFGSKWGDKGFIKIVRSSTQPIAKRAIFPNTLGNISGL